MIDILRLAERIAALERLAAERIAVSNDYHKKLEELKVDVAGIEARINLLERAVAIIQTKLATVTALAALLGAAFGDFASRLVGTVFK